MRATEVGKIPVIKYFKYKTQENLKIFLNYVIYFFFSFTKSISILNFKKYLQQGFQTQNTFSNFGICVSKNIFFMNKYQQSYQN